MKPNMTEIAVPIPGCLFRGKQRLRIALVGLPNSGKSTLFSTVSATSVHTGELTGTHRAYGECRIQIGLDEADLINLPSIASLHNLKHDDRVTLQYLLWGDQRPMIAAHDSDLPPAPFSPPDLIIQVVDATSLGRHLELTMELSLLGLPVVIALNMIVADRHHRAASLFEAVSRLGDPHTGRGWRYWLDELFLHPHFGLIGSLAVFAAVLFVVFEVSSWIDGITSAKFVTWTEPWQPTTTLGVIGRAIADGLTGLIGIVVPYMIPLVMLLVALEESGIMQRIAFVVDRWFHHLGLHGGVAVPFLLDLGCNVPALSAAATSTRGRERLIASLLITFVPCSAHSAVILALAGKYLGSLGIFAIFMLTMIVIVLLGQIFRRYYRAESGPGQVQEIPAYALPSWRSILRTTWERTNDILTIVTPLLVGSSVVLALLGHFGADKVINTALTPISHWWLGLPVVLGVPILFGILRKELSLLMVYQALGGFDVGSYMDWVQIMTFLIFLTFYFPCISTFAVMLRTLGRRQAVFSISLSIGVALIISGAVRALLEISRHLVS
jgi:ferrous iron transport protein B